ncbi:hypothetical protein BTE28158_02166 [Burkholderia territorii]|nr:hypothetical protein BTE28158_02166 [Burkholderia territorii]
MRILAVNANTTGSIADAITARARAASEADRQPAGRLRRMTARANA